MARKSSAHSPIIDIESIRKSNWREGRDEVIIVDNPGEPAEDDARDDNSTSLDALLARIEQAKSQLEDEDPSQEPSKKQYRLRGLIDNLSRAAEEMDRIEIASSHYRF